MSRSRLMVLFPISKLASPLGLASLLALAGCSALEVKLGSRISLAKTPVVSIQVRQAKDSGIAPGEKSSLVAALTSADGKTLLTEGKGKGKVLWKDLSLTASVVSASKSGSVSLPKDPRLSDGQMGHVTVTVPSHPGLRADLDIPLRYDYGFVASFSGSSGLSGLSGSSGADGMSGSTGSSDPDHPSAGGNGTNGSDGADGGNGGDGSNGPPVEVRVALRAGSHPLLQVVVAPGNREGQYFLVDPYGGSLTVTSYGGSGGTGGKGGSGGRGGSGGIGTPNGSSGRDGLSGHDGRAGSDGRGGSITVIYDLQAKPFLNAIVLNSRGGPSPKFLEDKVGPLW